MSADTQISHPHSYFRDSLWSGHPSWLDGEQAQGQTVAGPDSRIPPVQEQVLEGIATRYGGGAAWGDSVDFNGGGMACGGIYSSWDETIAAVGYERDRTWPCGTPLFVCGPVGCVQTYRSDTCPGCLGNHLDLSEVAHQKVCGVGTCLVTIEVNDYGEHD